MNGKRIWLQMKVWVEEQDDLISLLPDPLIPSVIPAMIRSHYPGGVDDFVYDITHSHDERVRRDKSREWRKARK